MKLVLRTRDRGGDPQPPQDLRELEGRRRILFLVHGYNNNVREANEAYDGFERLQRELIGNEPDYARGWKVVRVYWPGDATWGLASPLFYMDAIGAARRTGEIMCDDVVARLPDLQEAMFVAHSLGCRVVMETLKHVRERGIALPVARVVFFAAAVPTFKLEQHGAGGLGWAAQEIEDGWLSLWSEADMALGSTFPLGQTLAAGDEGELPWALGYRYWVPAVPLIQQAENRGAGHGDYWGRHGGNRQERFANEMARSALRLEPLMDRTIEERPIPARETEARELGESQVFYGG